MVRIQYLCICDRCKEKIANPNDENDVTMNSGHYVYCRDCYYEFQSIWESWTYSKKR